MFRFVFLMLALTSVAGAESPWLRWARRSTAVVACAASAYDGWQSAAYLDGHHGLTESTPLYRRADGTVRVPAMSVGKALFCVVPILAGEKLPERFRPAILAVVGVNLGLQLTTIERNRRLIRQTVQ